MAEVVPISVVPAFSVVWAVFGKDAGDAYALRVVAWAMDAAVEERWGPTLVRSTPLVEMFDDVGAFFGIESAYEIVDFRGLFRVESEELAIRAAFIRAKS